MSAEELVTAGRILSAGGLVDAFGHVSVRTAAGTALMTPARPLGGLAGPEELVELPLGPLDQLPAGVPNEGWIHWAAYRGDEATGAVCRAQPPAALAVGAVADALPALHGQGAIVGAPVPVFDEARLVRERARGEALAAVLGGGCAVIMRGNGAVTTGASVGAAVARMVLLEHSARLFLAAKAAGSPRPLREEEVTAWQAVGPELLDRYWRYLRTTVEG